MSLMIYGALTLIVYALTKNAIVFGILLIAGAVAWAMFDGGEVEMPFRVKLIYKENGKTVCDFHIWENAEIEITDDGICKINGHRRIYNNNFDSKRLNFAMNNIVELSINDEQIVKDGKSIWD